MPIYWSLWRVPTPTSLARSFRPHCLGNPSCIPTFISKGSSPYTHPSTKMVLVLPKWYQKDLYSTPIHPPKWSLFYQNGIKRTSTVHPSIHQNGHCSTKMVSKGPPRASSYLPNWSLFYKNGIRTNTIYLPKWSKVYQNCINMTNTIQLPKYLTSSSNENIDTIYPPNGPNQTN